MSLWGVLSSYSKTFSKQGPGLQMQLSHSSCLLSGNMFLSVKAVEICLRTFRGVFASFVFYVEMDLLLFFSSSTLSSSVMAHGWIFPLPNMVKMRAPPTLMPAATQNTFLQPARVCWQAEKKRSKIFNLNIYYISTLLYYTVCSILWIQHLGYYKCNYTFEWIYTL